ncbi:hypothetical protein Tco_1374259 [Tanacetum coccineum]
MPVRVPPAMSPGLSASMAEVVAMSESAFRKRFRSSYESLPSSSPLDLPTQKHYRGTSELVEDDKDDDDEEDEEIEEILDSDSVSEDAEEEGPTVEDEDPAVWDEGLAAGDEVPGMGVKSCDSDDESRGLDYEVHSVESDRLGLGEDEEAIPEGQQRAVPVVGTADRVLAFRQPILTTWTDPKDGIVYIDVPAYPPPAPRIHIPPSPEWSSGLLPISPSPSIVSSPISSPMILLIVPSPVATSATAKTEGFLTELGAQVEMQGG